MTVCPSCGVELETTKRRSLNANAYLWGGVYGPIAAHLGYEDEEVHDLMRGMFLSREDLSTGLTIPGRTSKLPPDRFARYVDQVRAWSHAFLGLYIETPDEWRERQIAEYEAKRKARKAA